MITPKQELAIRTVCRGLFKAACDKELVSNELVGKLAFYVDYLEEAFEIPDAHEEIVNEVEDK